LLRSQARERGIAVIVVSSDGRELAGLCDRVLVFSRGHVVGELSGADVSEAGITETMLTATNHRVMAARRVNRVARWLAGDLAPLAMTAAAILALGIITATKSSFYLAGTNVNGTLALVAVLGFAAMGQTVALSVGAIDLSVGPLMGFIVVVEPFFIAAGASPGSQVLGWVLLVLVPVAVGLANWALVDLVKLNSIVATLITYIALQALSLVFRPQPGGQFTAGLTDALTLSAGPVPVAFILLAAAAVILQVFSRFTRSGMRLRAVGSDLEAARRNGANPQLVRLAAFLLCSLLAAVSALVLIAQVGTGDPTSGVEYTLTSISAAVIGGASIFGGRGSFIGTLGAAVLVTQAIGAVNFLGLGAAWSSYLPGLMTLLAVAAYSKSRQLVTRA
jgi:ribose transport system ATP-binding protein